MTQKKQIAPLSRSMDSDSGDKYINTSEGFVRERINMRTNELDGNSLFNKKLKGNVLVDLAMPAGTNKCIGWTDDYKTETLLWFVYNSNGDHSVLRYFVDTNIVQKVWYAESGLGLIDHYLGACVVDGRVYWVNGTEQLKSFNIEKAVNYTNTLSGDKYSASDEPFEDAVFPMIKRPPQFAPEVNYERVETYNGVAIEYNNLRKKLFQFKYCFIYEDFQQSAWSPISQIQIPVGELNYSGEFILDILMNNAIRISLSSGSHLVKKILIAARDSSNRDAPGDFYIIDEIKKFSTDGTVLVDSNKILTHLFLNNKTQSSINTDVNNRYFDDVPLSASDLLLLNAKYLTASMPVKGYDNVDVDYSLAAKEEVVESGASLIIMTSEMQETATEYIFELQIPAFYPTSRYTVNVSQNYISGINVGGTYVYDTISTGDVWSVQLGLIDAINNGGLFVATAIGTDKIGITFFIDVEYGLGYPTFDGSIQTAAFISPILTLKRGQFHPFAIVYNDEFGRYSVCYGDKEMYSPISLEAPSTDTKRIYCEMTIRHRPPLWANTFRVCYLPNKSYTYVMQIPTVKVTVGSDNLVGVVGNSIPMNKTMIQPNASLAAARRTMQNTVTPDYVWQAGDVMRIVGTSETISILGPYQIRVGDPEVITDGFLIDNAAGLSDMVIPLLEIFRPNTLLADKIFYEIGEEYEIGLPGTESRFHTGSINQSQDLTTAAVLNLDFGDVYLRNRAGIYRDKLYLGDTYASMFSSYTVEDKHNNDFYTSSGISLGRAVVKIETEQKELHRVVRSENFIEDSEYNLLNVWLPQTDFFTVYLVTENLMKDRIGKP